MNPILIPAATVRRPLEVRKSRFIAIVGHADSAARARAFIGDVRNEFPDASHVCWAYIAGEPGNTTELGCSDDGEPTGTAGKPILNVLEHSGFAEIVAVVVRYFGGVKLGTGGLMRAYSGSVSALIQELPSMPQRELLELNLSCDFAHEAAVRHLLDCLDTELIGVDYARQVHLGVRLPEVLLNELCQRLDNLGRGQIGIHGLSAEG